jgi:hypothetical protein
MLTNKYYLIRLVYKWHSPELNLIHWNLMVRNGNSDVIQNCWNDACFWAFHTSGAGTAYPSGAPEFTPGFHGVRVTLSLVLWVCFVDRCLSFCSFTFGHIIVLFVPLRCTDSDYPVGIVKLFSFGIGKSSFSHSNPIHFRWQFHNGVFPLHLLVD